MKITRRQMRAWLAPMRACLREIRNTGEADEIRGYAVTRLHHEDSYARIDYCIAGFRGLLARLLPDMDASPLLRIEKKLANGVPLTVAELDAALRLLTECEDALVGYDKAALIAAVQTEQIAIEIDQAGLKAA